MKPSDEIRQFIRDYEKCSLVRYNDSAGRPTIGVGHLLTPGDSTQFISQQQADDWYVFDVDTRANALNMYVTCDPSQQQYDAILSLAYNEGVSAIGHSTLMQHLNNGDPAGASYQFPKWVYANDPVSRLMVVQPGLVKRRAAERNIFDYGTYDSTH